jgi:hypothetical protein
MCLQLPQRAKPSDIMVEGVDYDPDDLYDNHDSSSSSSGTKPGPGSGSRPSPDADPASDSHNQHRHGSDSDNDSESESGSEDPLPWPQRFPGLYAAVAAAIAELGGAVAPRTNWSSPTDALWLSSSNSLRCTHPDEVSRPGMGVGA